MSNGDGAVAFGGLVAVFSWLMVVISWLGAVIGIMVGGTVGHGGPLGCGRGGCSALAGYFGLLAHPCLCSGMWWGGWQGLALLVEVPPILSKNGVSVAQKAVKTAFCVNKKKKITIKINVVVIFVSLPAVRRIVEITSPPFNQLTDNKGRAHPLSARFTSLPYRHPAE